MEATGDPFWGSGINFDSTDRFLDVANADDMEDIEVEEASDLLQLGQDWLQVSQTLCEDGLLMDVFLKASKEEFEVVTDTDKGQKSKPRKLKKKFGTVRDTNSIHLSNGPLPRDKNPNYEEFQSQKRYIEEDKGLSSAAKKRKVKNLSDAFERKKKSSSYRTLIALAHEATEAIRHDPGIMAENGMKLLLRHLRPYVLCFQGKDMLELGRTPTSLA